MAKKFTKQTESGEAGIALIHRRVAEMGFIWHGRHVDHGIDGEIELVDRDRRRPLNRVVWVQSKAQKRFPGENERQFHYVCNPNDVDYWAEANVPVILICSHPDTDEAWWAPVSELFKDPMRRAARRVDFDKRRDAFGPDAAPGLIDVAVPPKEGLHVPSVKRAERLMSNLLRVERYPETIWAAPALVNTHAEAWEILRRHDGVTAEWMILDRTVFSFRRTDDEPLCHIADGSPEAIDALEWADAKSMDVQRRFVRLLNQALSEMHHRDLRRHPKRQYLYFRATSDLLPRTLSTGRSTTGRVVFRAYPRADEPEGARHFRHYALQHRFVRLDGRWFLELSPTYHFTFDGYRDLPWSADLVKGMKRRERNAAVRSLIRMWARYLTPDANLFGEHADRPIDFGGLESFEIDRGIDERAWKAETALPDDAGGVDTLFDGNP